MSNPNTFLFTPVVPVTEAEYTFHPAPLTHAPAVSYNLLGDEALPQSNDAHNVVISYAARTVLTEVTAEAKEVTDTEIALLQAFDRIGELNQKQLDTELKLLSAETDLERSQRRARSFENLFYTEVSKRIAMEEKVAAIGELLEKDQMTGSLNASGMQKKVEALNPADGTVYLASFDLGDFKLFNDRLGHPKADEMLRIVAFAIKMFSREDDLLSLRKSEHTGRPHGDEFIYAIQVPHDTEYTSEHIIKTISERVHEMREFVFALMPEARKVPTFHLDVGVVAYDHEVAYEENLAKADSAMYRDKMKQRKIYGHVGRSNPDTKRKDSQKPASRHHSRIVRGMKTRDDTRQTLRPITSTKNRRAGDTQAKEPGTLVA